MSPESLTKYEYSSKSDVWSFGILLYELTYNDTPLSKCKSEEELREKVFQPIRFCSNINPDLKELI
jgi:serine/threonine protein kinase